LSYRIRVLGHCTKEGRAHFVCPRAHKEGRAPLHFCPHSPITMLCILLDLFSVNVFCTGRPSNATVRIDQSKHLAGAIALMPQSLSEVYCDETLLHEASSLSLPHDL
jgi:hypothetical protein